jgi:hypothetical protein
VAGAIELTGETPSGVDGIALAGSLQIIVTGLAPVTLISDRMNLTGDILVGSSTVTLHGKTSGRPINLGGDDTANQLGLSAGDLGGIAASFVRVGDGGSGDVTVSQPMSLVTDLFLKSGTTIDVNQDITLTLDPEKGPDQPGGNFTFDAPTINTADGVQLTTENRTVNFQVGTLNVGDSPGSLSAIGRLLLANSATHHAEIGGLTGGVEYDQIVARDGVTIDSATLDLDFSFTPAIGNEFLLIENISRSATNGTFADLPEGAFLSVDGMVFQITYTARVEGADANDVIITRVTPPPTTSLVVDNTGDDNDGNYGSGQHTLREAIHLANLQSDQSTISFDATVFTGTKTITLTEGELPELVQPVTITGPAANRLTIDAADLSRHLTVAAGKLVQLSGMTFSGGFTDDVPGGSINNHGQLIVNAMTFEQNVADGAPGGAIANDGSLIVNDSMFLDNTADNGGAIFNTSSLLVFNTTISGNSAIEAGGGVANFGGGPYGFVNSTIVANSAGLLGGAGVYSDVTITLENTIVAGNTLPGNVPSDLHGVAFGGNNLIGDAASASGFTDGGVNENIVGINGVGTRPLDTIVEVTPALNGGPTKTHKLAANSKAIDAGNNESAIDAGDGPLMFDQRGNPFVRIFDGDGAGGAKVDIGAFEQQESSPITRFILINADTDQPIQTIGAQINLASLPTRNLNIQAETNSSTVQSVRFGFDGNNNYRVENIVPYALFSDKGGNFHPGTLTLGNHTLSATPFSGDNATGSAGVPLAITFEVVDEIAVTGFMLINADTDQPIRMITGGEEINLTSLPTRNLNIEARTSSPAVQSVRFGFDGNNNYRVENIAPYALFSDRAGNFHPGTLAMGTHTLSATPFPADNAAGSPGMVRTITFQVVDEIAVTGFTLINADTDRPIGTIVNGGEIDLATLPTRNLNIRADTNSPAVQSVRFAFDGNNNYRVENIAPYALFSDRAGNYHPGTLALGGHSLSATPYTLDNAQGDAGTPSTISFTVVDGDQSAGSALSAIDAVFDELSASAAALL